MCPQGWCSLLGTVAHLLSVASQVSASVDFGIKLQPHDLVQVT